MSEIQVNTINEYTGASGVTIDGLLIKDGAIPSISGGKVLQVVQATYSTQGTSTSTSFTDTGLTASITPSNASNKVLVIIQHNLGLSDGTDRANGKIKLLRDTTDIWGGTSLYPYTRAAAGGGALVNYWGFPIVYLDSPSTTSSTTYKTQYAQSGNGTVYVAANSSTETITLMEIDGT
jgi:hypothetical protein